MSIWVSIILITIAAVSWNLGVVFQKQAADVLPQLGLGRSTFSTLKAFLTNWKWMLGLVISGLGWGFFAYALDYTPISLARAIQGSGFVMLALFSVFFLNHHLSLWEWGAVVVVTGGIVALGFSEPPGQQTDSTVVPQQMIVSVAVCCGVCLLFFVFRKALNIGPSWAALFGIISGVCAGLGDTFTRTVMVLLNHKDYISAFVFVFPFLVIFYISNIFILSRGFQHGRAIVVVAVNDFCARLVAIFVGVYGLSETFPEAAYYRTLRISGLLVVLFGTILLTRFSGEQLADEMKKKQDDEEEFAEEEA